MAGAVCRVYKRRPGLRKQKRPGPVALATECGLPSTAQARGSRPALPDLATQGHVNNTAEGIDANSSDGTLSASPMYISPILQMSNLANKQRKQRIPSMFSLNKNP
ncbi:unnamed protein product [Protopolystoma xenopodis]|uniref:Uncharacterized protein n=1 Tax=Protopolystoma xenopodis TaxID=117903 RepID=A0A448XDK3_9PLAT|nr:unnamed protein product [Protopolystoma xenopodis]